MLKVYKPFRKPKGRPSRRSSRKCNRGICWACGKRSKPCCRGNSLKDQGWYCERLPFDKETRETYCKKCLDTYGPPEVWVPKDAPKSMRNRSCRSPIADPPASPCAT